MTQTGRVYILCTMAAKRSVAIRVSERAHRLAKAADPEVLGRGVELALELLVAMKRWERDEFGPDPDGPLSPDAWNRLTAHHAIIVDRIIERAVSRGIAAYRAEKYFADREVV